MFADTTAGYTRKVEVLAGSDGQGTPCAIILTATELTGIIEKISAKQFDDADTFSIQSIVEPSEDVRIVSVYSCDLGGD